MGTLIKHCLALNTHYSHHNSSFYEKVEEFTYTLKYFIEWTIKIQIFETYKLYSIKLLNGFTDVNVVFGKNGCINLNNL